MKFSVKIILIHNIFIAVILLFSMAAIYIRTKVNFTSIYKNTQNLTQISFRDMTHLALGKLNEI
jgi:hypothetical protein